VKIGRKSTYLYDLTDVKATRDDNTAGTPPGGGQVVQQRPSAMRWCRDWVVVHGITGIVAVGGHETPPA
jgi:hypothetical protein